MYKTILNFKLNIFVSHKYGYYVINNLFNTTYPVFQ